MKTTIALFILLGVFFLSANVQAADVAAGKTKFETYCVTCHGPKGLGDGVAAAAMNPKPRNLQITKRNDNDMKTVIKGGGAAGGLTTGMPAWGGTLSDDDIANVIAYVRTLKGAK